MILLGLQGEPNFSAAADIPLTQAGKILLQYEGDQGKADPRPRCR